MTPGKKSTVLRFLITAGGTREYIDPVRFVSNASSGKTGYALVRAAIGAGHKATLITAPTALRAPAGAKTIKVETAAGMFEAVKKYFDKCNCLIMTAAVADYAPAGPAKNKMKKTGTGLTIKLKPTKDILKWAGRHKKKNQLVVGFALEDKAIKTGAEKKLVEKNLDMIIANTPAAIGADKSVIWIKTPDTKWAMLALASKIATAKKIIAMIENIASWHKPLPGGI